MPVIPATWEAEIGVSWSKAFPGKNKTLPEKQTKDKSIGRWLKW
jgi:hypothetical protein